MGARAMAVVLLLLCAACSDTEPIPAMQIVTPLKLTDTFGDDVYVVRDEVRGVTCWVFGRGISCLPNSALKREASTP